MSSVIINIAARIEDDFGWQFLPNPPHWMKEPLDDFVDAARVTSPVWTGALRSSIHLDDTRFRTTWIVQAGDPEIRNPVTGTPTPEYASIQEAEKAYMQRAYTSADVRRRLDAEANDLFRAYGKSRR